MDLHIKALLALVCGLISTACDRYGAIFGLVCVAVMMDFATGLIKAKVSGEGFDSGIGWLGFWKKIALLMAMLFGVYLDASIPQIVTTIGLEISCKLPFGLTVGSYIIINEAISIAENLYICDPGIIPAWIVRLLKVAKNKIDEKGDGDERRK
jgi:toxin secretion/phage lysis holin